MLPSDVNWLVGFGVLVGLAALGVLVAALASRRDWKKGHGPDGRSGSLFEDED